MKQLHLTREIMHRLGLALLLCMITATAAFAQEIPGRAPADASALSSSKTSGTDALNPVVTETGFISLSIDGCGTTSSSCTIDVDKPAGGTVRGAWFTSASQGFSGFQIPNGTVTINGAGVSWDATTPSSIASWNHFADVTSIVAPIINAAAPGVTALTIGEGSSIEGHTLVVVFDDPAQTLVATAVIAFGAQATTGDTFNISLAEPFDNATQDIELSLAISFGNQSGGQFSLIDVNGTRMTSSAGDFDDGALANGALYTVGGLGDDPGNPADPNCTTCDDDELYTLDPFIPAGATDVTVFSRNPSNDDNIHLATFLIHGTAAIIGEGILLTPLSATNPVNTNHTVTASVQDDNGDPVSGRTVDFEVISGPNTGLTGSDVTDASGDATFTWSSASVGTDVIVARFENSLGVTVTSNQATKTWRSASTPCTDPSTAPSYAGGYVLNAAGSRAFIHVSVPQGGVLFEFYNTTNLTIEDPEGDTETGAPLAGVTRAGDAFLFAAPSPTDVYFPVTPTDASSPHVAFFLKITDTCQRTVDVDPSFALTGVEASNLEGFALGAAQPNPMANEATIRFSLDVASAVRLAVYDVLGREVARLADGPMAAGSHEAHLVGPDLPAGVYLYRLEAGGRSLTRTLTVAR